ncbi:hypothetical protein Tsubulata_048240, partial [Turnera subulata]
MRGTIGYLAPEWISGVAITSKADVYCFGMMLFELISGGRNSDQPNDGRMEYFPALVVSLLNNKGDVLSLLDRRLEGNSNGEEVIRICRLACWCIQDDETQRPAMGLVVRILECCLDMSLPPIPKFLQLLGYVDWSTILFTESTVTPNFLERNADVEELTRLCRLACWCIQDDESRRPSMGQIVRILKGCFDMNLPPIPRFLQMLDYRDKSTMIFIEP